MATNDFLPFAAAGGANVLAQPDWQALAARLAGYTAGVASSSQINKGLRQSAAMAAMIGQFISDYGALDALDDGNIANLERDFARSIQAGKFAYVIATGTVNAWIVTPTPAVATYAAGRVLNIVPPGTNTSTTVTANISGLGTRSVKKADGTDPAIGDLVAGKIYATIDDGTSIRILASLPSDAQSAVNTMPIFPAISGSGAFTVTAGTASVTVGLGQTWTWRGIRSFNTSDFASGDRTLSTVASKTYHLVWDAPGTGLATPASTYPLGRFSLIDRTSVTETDPQYDSTYDRMLAAKVVTNASNVSTITPLLNQTQLTHTANTAAGGADGNPNGVDTLFTLNWSRQPQSVLRGYFKPTDANYYSININFAAGAPTRYGFGIRSHAIRISDSATGGGFATTFFSQA